MAPAPSDPSPPAAPLFQAILYLKGLQCVTYSMVMELFQPGWRTLAGCVVEAFWATGKWVRFVR